MLTTPHIMERLSVAYIHAVSGRAGINIASREEHDYGIDVQLNSITYLGSRRKRIDSGFPVYVQLKATTQWEIDDDNVIYDMEVDAYNMMALRPNGAIPYYIFVLCLSKSDHQWLYNDERSLVLQNCCYWMRETVAQTSNTSKIRVRIPRQQIVNVDSLREIMQAAKRDLIA
jgi:hypothetical protein